MAKIKVKILFGAPDGERMRYEPSDVVVDAKRAYIITDCRDKMLMFDLVNGGKDAFLMSRVVGLEFE